MVCAESNLDDPGWPPHPLGERELVASATGLARLVTVAEELAPTAVAALALHPMRTAEGELYPEPHSPLFDFEATAGGAGWIDELARVALVARDGDTSTPVVAHTDWSARNVRLWPDGIRAIYDADSLSLVPESTAVGIAAATWSAFGEAGEQIAPLSRRGRSVGEAYERAGRPLTPAQRHAAGGAILHALAYTARCEHALDVGHPELGCPRRARDRLEPDGAEYIEQFEEACGVAALASGAMTLPIRPGMTVPFGGPLHAQRAKFEELADLGYTDVWSAESDGGDAFTPLAAGVAVGAGVAPRHGDRAGVHPGAGGDGAVGGARCVEPPRDGSRFGIGTSSNVIVERWNGVPFVEPYKRVRDMVRFLRAALTGEKVPQKYDTFEVQGFRLGLVPEVQPPILVAAFREGMLRLAGPRGRRRDHQLAVGRRRDQGRAACARRRRRQGDRVPDLRRARPRTPTRCVPPRSSRSRRT